MKEEIKAKIDELGAKVNELAERTKDSIDTAKIKTMYAKDEAKERIEEKKEEHRGNIAAIKENLKLSADRAKSKASSELLKTQMNIDVAKEKLAEKKEAHDKAKLEEYICDVLEYADACVELSVLAAEEAQLAVLEAIAAEQEYEELYGEDGE